MFNSWPWWKEKNLTLPLNARGQGLDSWNHCPYNNLVMQNSLTELEPRGEWGKAVSEAQYWCPTVESRGEWYRFYYILSLLKGFDLNGFYLFGMLGFALVLLEVIDQMLYAHFCIVIKEMLAGYFLYSAKDSKFNGFCLFVAFTLCSTGAFRDSGAGAGLGNFWKRWVRVRRDSAIKKYFYLYF